MFLIVKQGQTRTIRKHVFLIITQGVIGGDKDFRKNQLVPYLLTGSGEVLKNFVARPYLLTGKSKIFNNFFFSPYHHTGPHKK